MIQKTENFIQQEIVIWFNNNYCLSKHNPRCMILSIPNGGARNSREGKTLKNTGLLPGASDLIVILPNNILLIEVKTDTGIQSNCQISFMESVKKLGHHYYLVRSLDEFKNVLNPHLKSPPQSHNPLSNTL